MFLLETLWVYYLISTYIIYWVIHKNDEKLVSKFISAHDEFQYLSRKKWTFYLTNQCDLEHIKSFRGSFMHESCCINFLRHILFSTGLFFYCSLIKKSFFNTFEKKLSSNYYFQTKYIFYPYKGHFFNDFQSWKHFKSLICANSSK